MFQIIANGHTLCVNEVPTLVVIPGEVLGFRSEASGIAAEVTRSPAGASVQVDGMKIGPFGAPGLYRLRFTRSTGEKRTARVVCYPAASLLIEELQFTDPAVPGAERQGRPQRPRAARLQILASLSRERDDDRLAGWLDNASEADAGMAVRGLAGGSLSSWGATA